MTEPLQLPDLCVPEPGSTTMHRVLSRSLRRAIADFPQVLRLHGRGPCAPDVAEFLRVVGPLVREEPGAIAAAVRRAEVGVWIRCLRPGSAHPIEPMRGLATLLSTIALELARQGVLPGSLRLRRFPLRVTSSAGRLALRVPAGTHALRFESGGVWAEHREGEHPLSLEPDDEAFVELPGTQARLALVDDDPLAALEEHPEKAGNQLDLGGQPVERWRVALGTALSLIEAHAPGFRAEIELVLQQVVPVGWDEHRHMSATIQEAIGTVYLSLHPNPMTMAEALVHEVSHNKISALLELDPVLENPRHEIHASPVRPDPRPLHGVLLAVHAFLPVAALYAAMIDAGHPGSEHPDFRRRLVHVVRGNHEGAEVLRAHGRPTALGRQLLDEIAELDLAFMSRWGGTGP